MFEVGCTYAVLSMNTVYHDITESYSDCANKAASRDAVPVRPTGPTQKPRKTALLIRDLLAIRCMGVVDLRCTPRARNEALGKWAVTG